MNHLSIVQLVELWSRLEQCYYGDDAYGGDTAEIYAYTLQSRSPQLEHQPLTDNAAREKLRLAWQARNTLFEVCVLFASKRGVGIEIDGLPLYDWKQQVTYLDHRAHVRVVR